MFWEVFIKVLTYSIIITLVKLATDKLFKSEKEYKLDKKGNNYIDAGVIWKIYFTMAIVLSIFIIIVGSFPSNVQGKTKLIISAIAIGFNIIFYIVAIMYRLYYIKFGENDITYRNMLGKIRKYNYSDIEYGELSYNRILTLYSNNNKILKFSVAEMRMLILEDLWEKGIKIKKQSVGKSFVIEETRFYKGLSIFFATVMIIFAFFSIYLGSIFASFVFIIASVLTVFDLLKRFKKRIVVSEKSVVVIEFLKKEKEVQLSKIKYMERKMKDGAEITYIYSNDGLEFKYSSIHKNAAAFEDIIDKYRWKEK